MTRILLLAAAAVLAACANQPTQPAGNGKFLVSEAGSASGWQFEYTTEKMCRDVEKAVRSSGGKATCQETSAAGSFKAKATLRYNPPGVLVHGHYASMDFCRNQTAKLSPGVELINPCSAS